MPEFPYPPSVSADLRALFRKDREGRTSRNLGLSSITRGEGSLDLYESDEGPVRARYGDLPGGAFGVGITHRGAFWNVSDLIGAGEDRDTAQDGRMDGHDGRIGAAEGRLDSHASRIGATESKDTAQDGRLDAHALRLGSAEGRLTTVEGRNSIQDGQLADHATLIANRVTNGQLNATNARVTTVEGRNSIQDGQLDAHASRIGALENRATAIENEIDHIKNWLQANTPYPDTIHPAARNFLATGGA